eukprot:5556254-Pyramimonas_sp.AAC.1
MGGPLARRGQRWRLEEGGAPAKVCEDDGRHLKEFKDLCAENGLALGVGATTHLAAVDYFDA